MTKSDEIRNTIVQIAKGAREASQSLSFLPTSKKNEALLKVAAKLRGNDRKIIIEANQLDIENGKKNNLSTALMDRLLLTDARMEAMAQGVETIAALADPVGEIEKQRKLPNGLLVGKMRVPIGVIGIIYESRPNVTIDTAALCLKSGNAVILRGGKEAFHSNLALANLFSNALEEVGISKNAVQLIPTIDRDATSVLLEQSEYLDLIIPRGGEGLIRFVTENARMPVIQHYKGVCHVYVDDEADQEKAVAIVINSKTQRTGVCNALETLLVDKACAEAFIPKVGTALLSKSVEIRGDETVCKLLPEAIPAKQSDWDEEYLDLILAVKVVDGIDGALSHIRKHGSFHTESIITENYSKAQRWLREVDASLVLVNASTRFNDGQQLGLGAEMGISTSKLHAYGPMGLSELCTLKWIGLGEGQIRPNGS